MRWIVRIVPEAEAEIRALPDDMQARLFRIRSMIESKGPHRVGMPYVRPLEHKLWEMRLSGQAGIARAIYVATSGRQLVILHVFFKKTEATPRRAIENALRRFRGLPR